ncbi:hypothetical protein D9M71_537400 [compost metagenome]
MRVAQSHRWQVEQRGFLGDGATVGEHAESRHLQLDVVQQAERFDEADQRMLQRLAEGLQPLASARMSRDDQRVAILVGQRSQRDEQIAQVFRSIDVLFAVRADDEELTGLQPAALNHIGLLDLRHVVVEHLLHMRAGFYNGFGADTFGNQITPGMLGKHHVDIAAVVEYLAVQLLRYPLVETAVTCLHVKHRNLTALGGDHSQAGIGVAVQKQRIRPLLLEHLVGLEDNLSDGLRCRFARSPQKMIGLANLQIVEKDLIQLIIIILP